MDADAFQDYIGFLNSLEQDLIIAGKAAHVAAKFAPPDRKENLREIAKFVTLFGSVVIHNEVVVAEMKLVDLENSEKGNSNVRFT